jgi:hypothetical protein
MEPSSAGATPRVIWRTTMSALMLAFAGCAGTSEPGGDVGHYTVSAVQTPMFRYGPAQSFGPDFSLQQGQHVVMLKREFGYSRVMTDEGQSGYVATEDLAPSAAPKKGIAGSNSGSRTTPGSVFQRVPYIPGQRHPVGSPTGNPILEGGPLFPGGELPPLPEKDPLNEKNGEDAPRPQFRVPKPKPGFRVNVPPVAGVPENEKVEKTDKEKEKQP